MSDTVPSAFILLSCPPSYQLMHELLVNLLTGDNKAFVLPVTRNLAPTEAIHSIFWVIPIVTELFFLLNSNLSIWFPSMVLFLSSETHRTSLFHLIALQISEASLTLCLILISLFLFNYFSLGLFHDPFSTD